MPFVFVVIGLLLVIAAFRGRERELGGLLVGDFSGPNNFVYWIVSIAAVGFIGYIPKMKPFSDAVLFLILLVILLSNGGFFQKFNQSISATVQAPNVSAGANQPIDTGDVGGGGGSGSSSGGGLDTGTLIQGAAVAAMFL